MRWTLKKKAILLMVCLVVCPVFIMGVVSSLVARGIIEQKTNELTAKTMEKLSQYINRDLQYLSEMSADLSNSELLMGCLAEMDRNDVTNEQIFQKLRNRFLSGETSAKRISYPMNYIVLANNGEIYTPISYFPNGNTQEIKKTIQSEIWYKKLSTQIYRTSWVGFRSNWVLNASGEDQVFFASSMIQNNKNCGILLIGISQSYFTKLMDSFKYSPDSIVIFSDETENITLSSWGDESVVNQYSRIVLDEISSNKSGRIEIDGIDYNISRSRIQISNVQQSWSLSMLTPLGDITREENLITYVTIALLAFTVLSALVLVVMVNRTVVDPITNLSHLMKCVRRGDLSVRARIQDRGEIGQMEEGFNQMVQQLEANIERIQKEEAQKRRLEVQVLQAQINPHFIRNTLNTIRWMAELKRATGISRAITSFIKLMDYSFREQNPLITLSTEIAYLEEYVFLQRLRYQNRFQFVLHADETLMDVKILKLLLQPIVENSILHGLEGKKDFGTLTICFYRQDNALMVSVEDDGVGMGADQIESIMRGQACRTDRGNNHIGIVNIQERIKLHYGDAYGMSITSEVNKGTKVLVRLPLLQDEKES